MSVRERDWASALFREESLEISFLFEKVRLKLGLRVARQPAENLIDLGLGAPLLLRLGDVVRIDARKTHREYCSTGIGLNHETKSFTQPFLS